MNILFPLFTFNICWLLIEFIQLILYGGWSRLLQFQCQILKKSLFLLSYFQFNSTGGLVLVLVCECLKFPFQIEKFQFLTFWYSNFQFNFRGRDGDGGLPSLGKFHTSSPSQPKQWFSLSISFYQTFWGNIKWWLERFPILTYCPVHMESLSSQVNTSQRGEQSFQLAFTGPME